MLRVTWISRRIVIGLVVLTLTVGGFLFQPEGAGITDGTSNTFAGGIASIVEEN